jgi:hypothetical protein
MGISAADRSTSTSTSISTAAEVSTTTIPTKRSALYFLANSTFRVYFALKNLRLCDTVLNNVNNSNVSLVDSGGGGGKKKDEFGKADKSGFWYYRGRINLYQRRLGQARIDLGKSLRECNNTCSKNAR